MKVKTTPEDLVNLIIAADVTRRRIFRQRLPRYRPGQRLWIEPLFNGLGLLWGQLMSWMPFSGRRVLDRVLCRKMGGHPAEDNPALPEISDQAVSLALHLRTLTGRWPAVLVLTSHPSTEGSLQWLRFEILRQSLTVTFALSAARGEGGGPIRSPKCFLGIDPYALDTVTAAVGGFYAAWMHRVYLALDRQPSTQSWIQRHLLLRDSAYDRIAWRLIRDLKAGYPILMAMGGGLPINARVLYAAREFVHQLKPARWTMPKLEAERRFMEVITRPVNNELPAEHGTLCPLTLEGLVQVLRDVGLDAASAEMEIQRFTEEFRRTVPYRTRLLRFLLSRLVSKGVPLLLLTASHRDTFPHIQISEPLGVFQDSDGTMKLAQTTLGRTTPLSDPASLSRLLATHFHYE